MTKRIVSLLMIAVLVVGLLAACGNDGPLTSDDAAQVVLEDLGLKEKEVDSLDVHLSSTADGNACYAVYVTVDGEHLVYMIDGVSGEILSKEEADHGHSH
jgi:predicted small lipoprotein YifL